MSTFRVAFAALLCLAWAFSPQVTAQNLTTEVVASGLRRPIFLTSPPGDTSRLFILEQHKGRIKIVKNGALLNTDFLDVEAIISIGGTQGLLSMAFHPDYANNGRFFILYCDTVGDSVIAEYQVSAGNPDVADPVPVATIVGPVFQPNPIHNFDHIAFGPDGMLYVGTGDGGVGPYDTNNESQDLTSLLGKILRYDVDLPAPHIPLDNPFVLDPMANDAIWAYGIRQPWRFSFDRMTDELYIADVGEALVEEIDIQDPSSLGGENYGWSCLEGDRCTATNVCGCADTSLTGPVKTTSHLDGGKCAIIGGYVYRGSAIPWLQGTYFYTDWCEHKVRSFEYTGGMVTNEMDWTGQLNPGGTSNFQFFVSFGEDAAGELYILSVFGEVFRIIESSQIDPPMLTVTCNGDGGDQMGCIDCPCGNNNTPGLTGGCLNSSGTSADLTAAGSISPAETSLTFDLTGASPSTLSVLLSGNNLLPANGACPPGTGILGSPSTDGLRCVGGALKRHGSRVTDPSGGTGVTTPHWGPPNGPNGGIIAQAGFSTGQTRNFQAFYRDLANLNCMTGLNTSNAISITFGP